MTYYTTYEFDNTPVTMSKRGWKKWWDVYGIKEENNADIPANFSDWFDELIKFQLLIEEA